METTQEHLEALKKVAEAARNLERVLSGTVHPGVEEEKEFKIKELKKAVHGLDEVEGKRVPVGSTEKWDQ